MRSSEPAAAARALERPGPLEQFGLVAAQSSSWACEGRGACGRCGTRRRGSCRTKTFQLQADVVAAPRAPVTNCQPVPARTPPAPPRPACTDPPNGGAHRIAPLTNTKGPQGSSTTQGSGTRLRTPPARSRCMPADARRGGRAGHRCAVGPAVVRTHDRAAACAPCPTSSIWAALWRQTVRGTRDSVAVAGRAPRPRAPRALRPRSTRPVRSPPRSDTPAATRARVPHAARARAGRRRCTSSRAASRPPRPDRADRSRRGAERDGEVQGRGIVARSWMSLR